MQDLCGTLAEKDEMISRLQSKGNDMVDSVQKEYLNEKNDLIREKQALEEKIARMRYDLFYIENMPLLENFAYMGKRLQAGESNIDYYDFEIFLHFC